MSIYAHGTEAATPQRQTSRSESAPAQFVAKRANAICATPPVLTT